jgi:hypothetical protein
MDNVDTEEIFRCKHCKKLIDDPYENECCGSLFCKYCMNDLNYTKCKQCNKTLHFRKNLFAKNLMKKVKIKCEHGCGDSFNLEDRKLHLLRCENKLFKCNVDFCYCVERKKGLIDHTITSHFKELLIMMENYEDFKPLMEKILNNPNARNKNTEKGIYEYYNII